MNEAGKQKYEGEQRTDKASAVDIQAISKRHDLSVRK